MLDTDFNDYGDIPLIFLRRSFRTIMKVDMLRKIDCTKLSRQG